MSVPEQRSCSPLDGTVHRSCFPDPTICWANRQRNCRSSLLIGTKVSLLVMDDGVMIRE